MPTSNFENSKILYNNSSENRYYASTTVNRGQFTLGFWGPLKWLLKIILVIKISSFGLRKNMPPSNFENSKILYNNHGENCYYASTAVNHGKFTLGFWGLLKWLLKVILVIKISSLGLRKNMPPSSLENFKISYNNHGENRYYASTAVNSH